MPIGSVPISSMFPGRKSSSTSSLLEPSSSSSANRITVACTEQAASADSLVGKKGINVAVTGNLTRSTGDPSLSIAEKSNENLGVAIGLSPTQEETEEESNVLNVSESEQRPDTPTPKMTENLLSRRSSSSSANSTHSQSNNRTASNQSDRSSYSNQNNSSMSVSVPNLAMNSANVNESAVGLLDAFAAVAASATRRRSGTFNVNQSNMNSSNSNANVMTNMANSSMISRGSNNVCSLVRMAIQQNFPGNLPG